jgi:hypothetical protein
MKSDVETFKSINSKPASPQADLYKWVMGVTFMTDQDCVIVCKQMYYGLLQIVLKTLSLHTLE